MVHIKKIFKNIKGVPPPVLSITEHLFSFFPPSHYLQSTMFAHEKYVSSPKLSLEIKYH